MPIDIEIPGGKGGKFVAGITIALGVAKVSHMVYTAIKAKEDTGGVHIHIPPTDGETELDIHYRSKGSPKKYRGLKELTTEEPRQKT